MTQRPEMTEAESRQAKLIFFSSLAIGAILLAALALPSILERLNG